MVHDACAKWYGLGYLTSAVKTSEALGAVSCTLVASCQALSVVW